MDLRPLPPHTRTTISATSASRPSPQAGPGSETKAPRRKFEICPDTIWAVITIAREQPELGYETVAGMLGRDMNEIRQIHRKLGYRSRQEREKHAGEDDFLQLLKVLYSGTKSNQIAGAKRDREQLASEAAAPAVTAQAVESKVPLEA